LLRRFQPRRPSFDQRPQRASQPRRHPCQFLLNPAAAAKLLYTESAGFLKPAELCPRQHFVGRRLRMHGRSE
jgi:hypothetical protein